MGIYLVKRIDEVSYEEYAGFVIVAANPHAALGLAMKEGGRDCHGFSYFIGAKVTWLGEARASEHEEKVVLADYRAG